MSTPASADTSAAAAGKEQALAVTSSSSTLVVRARGWMANNVGPIMAIRINGVVAGTVEVRSTTFQDYSFDVPSLSAGAALDIVFTNDAVINKVDRNLEVQSITANGNLFFPEAVGGTYDRGLGDAAFDGKDVIAAQRSMPWGGALRLAIAASNGGTTVADSNTLDAQHLADQATFGATEALIAEIKTAGREKWITAQMALSKSRYTLGMGDAVHKNTSTVAFCDQPANAGVNCTRDWLSGMPLMWDFYRNATLQTDQLRQRVAFALQQIFVVSDQGVPGTYGLRNYHNMLLDKAFTNYRQVLKSVAMSPVMGDFLNNVNNDKAAPNENLAREMLQLFAIGTCDLNADGSLKGGACIATYDNKVVRNYAYALTGWTYPAGGTTSYGCWPSGMNCRYYGGDMVPTARYHDTDEHALLSGVTVPAGSTAPQALELVLDSVMNHPNMAPFVSRQLIQHLVVSNPSASYVQRVSTAFASGRYTSAGMSFGTGVRGDLAATVAAVLLDADARSTSSPRSGGKLREPALMLAGVLRAMNGSSDGDALSWTWSAPLNQHLFRPPSVFNFYPANYPVPGTTLNGPAFAIHNSSTALIRLNYLTYLIFNGGSAAAAGIPAAFGTKINLAPFLTDAEDPGKLVDRFSVLATGAPLPAATRTDIVAAVASFTSQNNTNWKAERVNQAAYLVFASPNYQIQR